MILGVQHLSSQFQLWVKGPIGGSHTMSISDMTSIGNGKRVGKESETVRRKGK
jgi:hypothetical protein